MQHENYMAKIRGMQRTVVREVRKGGSRAQGDEPKHIRV